MDNLRSKIHPGLRGALFYAAYWGVVGMFEPFINVHFLRLGFTEQQIGWLAAVFPLCNFIITPFISRMADRTNRRILFLAIACAGFGLSLIFLPIPTTFLTVLPVFALVVVFRAPIVALADSLIAKVAERRMLDFGRMRLWGSILFTITATALGFLWEKTGFTTMFILSGVFFILVVIAALLQDEVGNPPAADLQPNPASRPQARMVLPETGIIFLLAATFLIVGAMVMVGTFSTVYMTEITKVEFFVGAMFGLSAMGEVPSMMFGKKIAQRLGDTSTLILAYAVVALGYVGFGLSHDPYSLLVFSILRGLGFGLFLVTTVTIINQRAPENLYSTYQSLLNSLCWGLAPLMGGPISGAIYGSFGPSTLFFTTAAMTLMAILLILPTYRLWKPKPQEAALVS